MTVDAGTLAQIGCLVYAAGMFSGVWLEKYLLQPARKRKTKRDND